MRTPILVRGLLAALPLVTWSTGASSAEFRAVDTSKLVGSPAPLPYEAKRAFPNLKFDRPIELALPPGDETNRLFVAEQSGVIRVFENRPDVAEASVFLDLRDRVSREHNEEGLLGLAFHPRYADNGLFFVYYSTGKPRASVVSRFRVSPDDPDRAEADGETKVLEIPQPFANHNGGSIQFGPDGCLYVGLGDGGLGNDPYGNGQDLSTLLGSILRIDVDAENAPLPYAIPEDNPFVDRKRARGEIYAYGFRNVWRLHFDRKTGDLWCGDVGQERYEEIDRVVPGGNYGWKVREGRHPFDPDAPRTGDDLIDPVAEHFHGEGTSITGGVVYHGERLPDLRGRYVFGDYTNGFVWSLEKDGDAWRKQKIAETGLGIAAFGLDRAGEMYLCAFDGGLYRLQPRDLDVAAEAESFPRTLTETGLFESVADHALVPGVVPYDVNIPFWSDDAVKDRFIALPKAASVAFHAKEKWEFPVGTVFVKTFLLPLDRRDPANPGEIRRLETRLFVHGRDGWAGYTYVWNDEQTEADLIDEAVHREYEVRTPDGAETQRWHFPSRTECMACHAKPEKFVLGLNVLQMNRESPDPAAEGANQVDHFAGLGFFEEETPPIAKLESYPEWRTVRTDNDRPGDTANLARFTRGWLDVNCAMCHQPDGISGKVGGKPIDLRFRTPLAKTGIVGREPGQGQLTPQASAVLAPGHPARSELLRRIDERGERQMPPLATHLKDDEAIRVVRRWIESLPADGRTDQSSE